MLADGTVLCPKCGVDSVVPASKVRIEGELHAWRYLSFHCKDQDSPGTMTGFFSRSRGTRSPSDNADQSSSPHSSHSPE